MKKKTDNLGLYSSRPDQTSEDSNSSASSQQLHLGMYVCTYIPTPDKCTCE